MGTFWVDLEIGDPDNTRFERVNALVDTGSTYSVMPASLLAQLDVARVDRQSFILANGQRIHRDIGETSVRIDGRIRTTLVVFSDEESQALLGAYTLDAFSLAADPVNRRLVPVDALAMRSNED
jgi:clan AA aspartic protease